MKTVYCLVLAISLILCNSVLAINPVEKGDYWEHTQPNEGTPVTFMATQWGSPGLLEYEDSYGYSIIQSEVDGFWYYSILDTGGEYTPSTAKVAINNPPVATHLRRSAARVAEIMEIIDDHNRVRMVLADKWRYMWSQNVNTTIRVGVLLLNFNNDEQGYNNRIGRTDGISWITSEYLQDLITSERTFNWTAEGGVNSTPDGYETCGSVRDYYDDMTGGQIDIIGAQYARDEFEEGVPARTLLINPEEDGVPIWLEMDYDLEVYTGEDFGGLYDGGYGMYSEALDKCMDLGWLEENDSPPIDPGFDVIVFIYAGKDIGGIGTELDYPPYKGRDIPGGGNAGIIRSTISELRYGSTTPPGGDPTRHLSQVGFLIDELFDPLSFDLYPIFGWGRLGIPLTYSWYPRAAVIGDYGNGNFDEEDQAGDFGGGFVGEFDNACWSGGDFATYVNGWKHKFRRVENNSAYWNPRDRIKMGWYDNVIDLPEDYVATDVELEVIDEKVDQPIYYRYKYVDSYDGETPIYGSFYLETRRVMINAENSYVDFNSKGVGWNGCISPNGGNPWGYARTENENNLIIWHAEDQGPQIHVQFGDGHASCSEDDLVLDLEDENHSAPEEIDGHNRGNGNDYFPSIIWGTETPSTEFGPGTFQNRDIPATDYSSVDLCRFDEEVDGENGYDVMQTGFCVKNIVDDEANDCVTFDVYTNYWGGDVVEDLILSGENIYIGQDCEVKGEASISIADEEEEWTVYLDDNIDVWRDGTLFMNPENDQNENCSINLNGYEIRMREDSDLIIASAPDGEQLEVFGPGEFQFHHSNGTISLNEVTVAFRASEGAWRLKLEGNIAFDDATLILDARQPGVNDPTPCYVYLPNAESFFGEVDIQILNGDGEDRVVWRGPIIQDDGHLGLGVVAGVNSILEPPEGGVNPGDGAGISLSNLASVIITGLDVQYSDHGVTITNCSDVTLENVNVTDFQHTGFNLVNSSPEMNYCTASDASPYQGSNPIGIYMFDSSPELFHCEFDNNEYGAQVLGPMSMPEFGYCSMSDNTNAGLTLFDGIAYMYNSSLFPNSGYNHVIDNGNQAGIVASGNATAYLGLVPDNGNNSIHGNSSYQIDNQTPVLINAQNNWWGSTTGPDYINGPVNYAPWLMSSPGGGPVPEDPGNKGNGGTGVVANDEDDLLSLADSLFGEGELEDAFDAYQEFLEDYPRDVRGSRVMRQIAYCLRHAEIDQDLDDLLDDRVNDRNFRVNNRYLAQRILAKRMADGNEGGSAIRLLARLLSNLDDDDEKKPGLVFQYGMIQLYTLGNAEAAEETFEAFLEDYGDHPLALAARLELMASQNADVINSPNAPGDIIEILLPTAYELHKPYPNPFNDVTTVRYDLPEASDVVISLHDVRGRKVKELVNKNQVGGSHTVDIQGRELSSGLYLVKMEAGQFNKTVKLTYVK